MVRFQNVWLGLFVAVGLTIAGCNGSTPTDVAEPPPLDESAAEIEEEQKTSDPLSETADGDDTKADEQTDAAAPDAEADMVAVSIYVMDDSCSNFEAESVKVSAAEAMTETVGEVLERHKFESFKLSGYRVNIENSKAIVDLRLAEDSERQFLSLSSCEQQGLFGGLEETLTQNTNWKVDQVEFTNRGEKIVL